MIDGGDIDVVHVEQEPAAGAVDDLAQELDLAHGRVLEGDIGRGILQQHLAPERLLHLVDVVGDAGKRLVVVGNRQKIVEIDAVMGRPGEMLGEQRRLVAVDHALQAREMLAVERPGAADRQRHAMQRERRAQAKLGQHAMRRAAVAHIVLGMHLEEAEPVIGVERLFGMLRLESDADARGRDRGVAGDVPGGHVSLHG